MKRLTVGIVATLALFLCPGTVFADDLDENITLKQSLEGFQFAAKVVRQAALKEGYSWEESRMVAIAAGETLKEGLSGDKLMKQVRTRAREKIKENEQAMEQTRTRTRTRTRNESGNMPDDVKRQINRAEENIRDERGIARDKR